MAGLLPVGVAKQPEYDLTERVNYYVAMCLWEIRPPRDDHERISLPGLVYARGGTEVIR
jgi:hypothetical protein